jgi:hypothetical protein
MEEKIAPPSIFLGIGLLGIAIGTAIVLTQTSILPVRQELGAGVTSWIVVCAGIVFAGIGGVFALTGFSGTGIGNRIQQRAPILFRVLNFLVAVAALVALATIASFAAFGPGPREFSFTVPFFGQLPGTEWIGRIFFAAAALLLWGVIAVFVWFGVRGEQSKKQDKHPL